MTLNLTVEKRNIFGKKLVNSRKAGKLPAVVYGNKTETEPVFVDLKEFSKMWKAAGESSIIELTEDGKKIADTLIHDTAVDPLTNEFVHVDFYAVDMSKPITAPVHLVFEGVAPAEKDLGAMIIKVIHEVEVEALPKDLPHEIKVDLSSLVKFDDRICISDIALPTGVKILAKADDVVVLAEEHKEEVIEETAPVIDMEKIEVVGQKGKKEEEVIEGEEGEEK